MRYKSAQDEFCDGTGFSSPDDVVAHGLRPLQEWCNLVWKYRRCAPRSTSVTRKPVQPLPYEHHEKEVSIAILHALEVWPQGLSKTQLRTVAKKDYGMVMHVLKKLIGTSVVKRVTAKTSLGTRKVFVLNNKETHENS